MRTYRGLVPTVADRADWTLPRTLRRQAASIPDAVYLDVPEEGVRLTYAETADAAERVAATLLRHGEPGDRVLIMGANSSAYVLGWFGAMLAGMVEVPLNSGYRGRFLEHQVRVAAPRQAIVDAEFAERFAESAEHVGSIERFWLVGDDVEAARALLAARGWAAEPFAALLEGPAGPGVDPSPRDLGAIFFTSGTTGPSKGVAMPHAHFHFFAEECVALTRLTADDAYLACGPMFHGNAQFLAAYPAMIAGARFVLRRRFSASRWASWMRDVTVTNFVGVMMDFVWQQPPRPDDAESRLRCVFAAPTARYVDAFRERFGVEAFVEVFGLTETAMPILSPYGEPRPPGAAGLAAEEWFDVRLVDPETDEEVGIGQVGELVVRPRVPWTTTLGYYGMPERTAEAFRNLWFHTGDGLRRDADGWYYFVDRLKDALRRRGENISSYEVEAPILEHPAVAEVAVVGVPADHEAGEDEVMAVVVLAPGASLAAAALWSWCDERMPTFAVPRYLRFVEGLPKTPSEKVRKVDLRTPESVAAAADRLLET